MKKFYFPLVYMFATRYKTKFDMVSWLIQRIIPVFIIIYIQLDLNISNFGLYLVLYLLSDMAFTSLYEVGYIYNDVITTKKETNPTIRLGLDELKYFDDKFTMVIFIKFITAITLLLLIFKITEKYSILLYMKYFIMLIVLMMISFAAHNLIRSRLNILTFTCLVFCKFSFAIILFIPINSLLYPFLIIFLMFPFPRILEHMTKRKYKFGHIIKFVGNHDLFRVRYFIVLILLTLIVKFNSKIDTNLMLMIFVYFFLYRLLAYMLVTFNLHQR